MADNKKITELPDSIPSGGFNFIVATGIENYRVTYTDVAEYSSIGTKTGQFTDTLTISGFDVAIQDVTTALSGNLAATGAYLVSEIATVSGNVNTVIANLVATGAYLTSEIATVADNVDTVSANLVATGAYLTGEIATVSGNVDTVSGEVQGILTTGLSTQSGIFSDTLTISGAPVSTGEGGKWLTGATLGDIYYSAGDVGIGTEEPEARLHVTGGDGRLLVGSGAFIETLTISGFEVAIQDVTTALSGNLVATGAYLTGEIATVSGNVDTVSANLVATGAYLTGEIATVSGNVDTVSANLVATGAYLTGEIATVSGNVDTVSANLVATGAYLTGEIATVSGDVHGILTTGLSTQSGIFSDTLTISGASVTTGDLYWKKTAGAGGAIYYTGGDVGIGTGAPLARLHVTGGDGRILAPSGDFSKALTISGVSVSTGVGGGGGTTYTAGTGLTLVGTEFNTAGTGVFTQVSGESGVFTDTLTISGNSVLTGAGTIDGGGTTNYVSKWSASDTLTDSNIYIGADAGLGDMVGINQDSPEQVLDISGSILVRRNAIDNNSSSNITIHDSDYETVVIESLDGNTGQIRLFKDGVESILLTADPSKNSYIDAGNFGIGTGAPLARLHVTGGDGRVLAPSGDFSKALTISGVSVSTGVGGGGGTTYTAGTGLTLVGTEFNTAGTGVFNQVSGASGVFTDTLTISGVSVSTGVGGGGGTPGGSDTNIQFNEGGSFGGSDYLTYDYSSELLSGASGVFDYFSGHTGYFRDYASGATGEWDFTTGSTGHWEEEVIVGTGSGVALIANDAGNVGVGWSGTPAEPIAAQLHVSGSTIISGSSEIKLDYDRLPKSNPDVKGQVWIDVVSGFLMISSGIASDPPIIVSRQLVSRVAAGGEHSLFLTSGGDVYTCGQNSYGQLGDNTTVNKLVPTYITGDVTGIAAGANHSIFLSTGSGVYTCGSNGFGQLGDGSTVNKDVPTYITGDVTGIAAGANHSIFLSTGSGVYTCGQNSFGQLGDNTTVNKLVPTYITGDVTGIYASNHSLFLSTGNESYACGLNNYGQLGDGTTVEKHVPTYITGDVLGSSAGWQHSMFLSTGSESYTCGQNSYGQLGDGSFADKHVPTYITGDVTGIDAGKYHSMFLSTGSESYTCGRNTYGQLGDGTTVDKDEPTYITGDVTQVSAGHQHSMFFSTGQCYYACGQNYFGQLGDGTTVDKYVPTYISGLGA